MTRWLMPPLALLFCAGAFAQFSQLAPTADGSELYFQSYLPLTSEVSLNLPNTGAIYRIQAGTVTRVTNPPGGSRYACGTGCIEQGNPQISGDGSVFSYTNSTFCMGGSSCLYFPPTSQSQVVINGQASGTPLLGTDQISSNGRFVYNGESYTIILEPTTTVSQLQDLQTGTTYQVPVMPSNGRQALTDAGQVLALNTQTGGLMLWSPQGTLNISTTETPSAAIVNAAGTWVVYESTNGSIWHLRGVNLSTGQDVLLAMSATPFNPSISNDGSLVLYLAVPGIGQTTQACILHPDGTGYAQLTNFPQQVDEAIIAGQGTTAFAITNGSIQQISVPSGAVQELIPRTPQCSPSFPSLVPGSIFPYDGSGLADSTATALAPLPTQLNGVTLQSNGTALPILSISPTEIWFQVPFGLTTPSTTDIELAHNSLFEGCPAVTVPIYDRIVSFFNPLALVAVHQDFSGMVSQSSPAQPAEIVHTYATGLGAVRPEIATGIPAPVGQLFPLANAFECHIGTDPTVGDPLNVTFAGLAPGMIGTYQVDIQMPADVSSGYLTFNCGSPGYQYGHSGGQIYVQGM